MFNVPGFAQTAPAVAVPADPLELATGHASADEQGKVNGAETLQNSDPALSNAALAAVKGSVYPPSRQATGSVQIEIFVNVAFGATL